MNNFSEKANFIFSIADLIRDSFNRGKYKDVILPFTVLRRIDYVLADTKQDVLDTYKQFKGKLPNLDELLRKKSGYAFYNTSDLNFEKLVKDKDDLAKNLKVYLNSFSPNMRDVLEKFDFFNTIKKLDDANLLYLVMERFRESKIDLHPDRVSNEQMGYIFEELIRKFNEALNENPGEHFTPREVIELMVNLLMRQDEEELKQKHIEKTVYDPCCGTGGMLVIAQDWIKAKNPTAVVRLFGQEVNPETYAVCRSDLYMKNPDGNDADNIKFGSCLAEPFELDKRFDYLLANPPYGKDWKKDKAAVENDSRFYAGTPRINDGQLLFLEEMLWRMESPEDGGSRVGIVMNGSPLFTGDAGSGESNIRRWILENDWLEAIVALPEQLFYNTGIATYIWVLSNRKKYERRGRVQLINAVDFYEPMRKSLGDKRREITEDHIEEISRLFEDMEENENSRVFNNTDFGYRKISIDRPLRLNFQATAERIERLREEKAFVNLAVSKKRKKESERLAEEAAGRELQGQIVAVLEGLPSDLYKSLPAFLKVLNKELKKAGVEIKPTVKKAICSALSERDESAEVCKDSKGKLEADKQLRDTENVPLNEDVYEYLEREVLPHVGDAWIDESFIDEKDGKVGKVGYEINFNRYFYRYQPPRDLAKIEAEIKVLEGEILEMLKG